MSLGRLLLIFVAAGKLAALGETEDPDEKLTKVYHLAAMRSLEIRGQIDFELVPSTAEGVDVTVETTRALFSQINVSNWWGWGTVAIESGLIGPRERGAVKVKIAVPALDELKVIDQSHGTATWPGGSGKVTVSDASSLELAFTGTTLRVEAAWVSAVTLTGQADDLSVYLRDSSSLDAAAFTAARRETEADAGSNLKFAD